jgi:uncharacterized phiE125 gp8 family phage protein
MKYKVITPVSTEPITLEEARTHLRIEPYGSPLVHPDDDYVTALISVARDWCEKYTKKALATQTIEYSFDEFKDKIYLNIGPVQSVSSIEYLDSNGASQTLSTSVYGLDDYEGVIYLKKGQSWPTVYAQTNAITLTIVAGYTNGLSPDTYPFPFSIKAAMLLIIGNLYENRQEDQMGSTKMSFNSLPMGVYSLLQPYRQSLGV